MAAGNTCPLTLSMQHKQELTEKLIRVLCRIHSRNGSRSLSATEEMLGRASDGLVRWVNVSLCLRLPSYLIWGGRGSGFPPSLDTT